MSNSRGYHSPYREQIQGATRALARTLCAVQEISLCLRYPGSNRRPGSCGEPDRQTGSGMVDGWVDSHARSTASADDLTTRLRHASRDLDHAFGLITMANEDAPATSKLGRLLTEVRSLLLVTGQADESQASWLLIDALSRPLAERMEDPLDVLLELRAAEAVVTHALRLMRHAESSAVQK
jgi:hypothetical protein